MKHNITIYIALIVLLFGFRLVEAQVTAGYFVVPNPKISEETTTKMENKIKVSLTKAGVNAVDGVFPLVIMIAYDEGEVIEVDGVRKVFQANGVLNLMLVFDGYNSVLASRSVDIQGIGFSKDIAYANAVKNISISPSEVKKLMAEAKDKYEQVLEPWCEAQVREAYNLLSKGNLDEAVSLVTKIPKSSKYYGDAESIIIGVVESKNQKLQEEQAQKQQEADRQQWEKERQYDILEASVKEYYATEREKWASQRSPDVNIYYTALYKKTVVNY
ncbi:MAG: hypothetical protein ACOYN6_03115 [Ignavibacteria bacterium]